ncbi:MAG TPA: hypothetical protein VI229_00385 [Burkholderiales bacterium]
MAESMRFSADMPLVVTRPFIFNGTPMAVGDPAPKECDERRLRQLYEARKLGPAAAGTVASSVVKTDAKGKPKEIVHERTNETAGTVAEHRGFGRWFVKYPDGREEGPMKKEAALKKSGGAKAAAKK